MALKHLAMFNDSSEVGTCRRPGLSGIGRFPEGPLTLGTQSVNTLVSNDS